MNIIAAIDLKDGHVVQLVGGDPANERVRLNDPVAVAKRWIDAGFDELHVVDLDGALGTGSNRPIIMNIIANTEVPVQVGGGLRDDETVDAFLDAGAARVIVGTRALKDPLWLESTSKRHPDRIVLAADVRNRAVVSHGWTESTERRIEAVLDNVANLPLAAVLVTDVTREGKLQGIDVTLFADVVATTPHAVFAAGGIRDTSDLDALESAGVRAVVLGMSLYTGTIDLKRALKR